MLLDYNLWCKLLETASGVQCLKASTDNVKKPTIFKKICIATKNGHLKASLPSLYR